MSTIVKTMVEIKNNETKSCFFKKTFLFSNLSMNFILKMQFLNLNNVKINFLEFETFWWIYISKKTILITKYIELIEKKEFGLGTLDLEKEIS